MSPEEPARYGLLIVVRRGEVGLYTQFVEDFCGPDIRTPVEVIWDRRHAERRVREGPVSLERRRRPRRQSDPETWTTLGFVLVAVQR